MNSKTRVVPIRVSHEIADYIDEKVAESGKSRGKSIERIITAYRNVETIAAWSGIDAESLCEQLNEMFMAGKFYVEDGRVKV